MALCFCSAGMDSQGLEQCYASKHSIPDLQPGPILFFFNWFTSPGTDFCLCEPEGSVPDPCVGVLLGPQLTHSGLQPEQQAG